MTNEEFSALMKMPKRFDDDRIVLPKAGETIKPLNISSKTTLDTFIMDANRHGQFSLTRIKLQERHQSKVVLVRLEIDAKPHMNPDGTVTSRNHIHVYREGYGMSWAYNLDSYDPQLFKSPNDFMELFYDFCQYCNIDTEKSEIQGVL